MKENKGITLIALIITIIVLLILAGITISLVMGDNGILNRTKQIEVETRGATVEEQANLWKADIEMSKYAGGRVESLEEILSRLQTEKLLTKEEVDIINAEENIYKEITIGSRTISFYIDMTGINTEKVNKANKPKLENGMIPVVYDNTVTTATGKIPAYWRRATNEEEWYDYKDTSITGANTSSWANAVTEDGSMWVWIPRYEYKIISGEGTSTVGEIAINFIPTTVNNKDGGITKGYRIHPAFEDGSTKGKNNNYRNGEWDEELSGIWVAKFEASRTDSTASSVGTSEAIKIQPDVKSWTNITTGNMYANSLNMFPTLNSHLIKNSEWGAVVYLTHSKYGKNKSEVAINDNAAVVTGGGNYKTNTNQSSTGNASGIYDLSGGTWERVAAYISNGNPNLSNYGSPMVSSDTIADVNGYQTKSSKYVTVYPYDSTSDQNRNNYMSYNGLKSNNYGYGDAMLETSTSVTGQYNTSWNSDYCQYPYVNDAFFRRGGYYDNGENAGMFGFSFINGNVHPLHGFRLTLAI